MTPDAIDNHILRRWDRVFAGLAASERRDHEAPALTDDCRAPDGECDGSCDDHIPAYLDPAPETR